MTQPRTSMFLEELDNSIATGKRVPLSNMVMVDRDRCRQLIADIRAELPADMNAAQSIIQNQKSIIDEARNIAEQTKADANMRASRAVNEANAQAQNTVNMANQKAQEMMRRTWAGRKLKGFRSIPPVDEEAVRDVLVKLSQLAAENEDIDEIEIRHIF